MNRANTAALAVALLAITGGGAATSFAQMTSPITIRVKSDTPADDPLGFKRLRKSLGDQLPTGRDVVVAQVEPPAAIIGAEKTDLARSHAPARERAEFDGVRFGNAERVRRWGSGHATVTGRRFYGRKQSFAPAIRDVHLYTADQFLRGLRRPQSFAPARIWNHSWIGSTPDNGVLLRALDRAAQEYEWLVVTGLANRGKNTPLLSSAFNVLSVGRSDGGHAVGAARVDRVYSAKRGRPHLVAPAKTVSEAVPIVASAAAMLVQAARDLAPAEPRPFEAKTVDGRRVVDGARALTLRAALMAGASRAFEHDQTPGFRADATVRTDNGLDTRFGAGQLNVYQSYQIIAGGQTDSVEDDPQAPPISASGYDVNPGFGQAAQERYQIAPGFSGRLTAALCWHVRRAGTSRAENIDLLLYDITDKREVVASSSGRHDTTELLSAKLDPTRRYELRVAKSYTDSFSVDYALAWRLDGRVRKPR